MRVAAGIFSFWQGAGEVPIPVGPWPSAVTQPEAKKYVAPKGFPLRWAWSALSTLGIAIPWIPRNVHALPRPIWAKTTHILLY